MYNIAGPLLVQVPRLRNLEMTLWWPNEDKDTGLQGTSTTELQLEKLRICSNACDFPMLFPILISSPLLERLGLDGVKRPATYVYSDRHRANIAELAQVLHESCPHHQELTVRNLPIGRSNLHALLVLSFSSTSSASCSSSSSSSPALIATDPPQSWFSLRVLQLEISMSSNTKPCA